MLNFEKERNKYVFFIINLLLALVFVFVFLPESISPLEGLGNILRHHNLIDTDAFYIGGFSGAYLSAALCLAVGLLFFALTNTKIKSTELAGLYMLFSYGFYGKTVVGVIPLMCGVYLYQYKKKRPLSGKSAMACFAASLSPLVTVVINATPALKPGSPWAIIVGLALGLLAGYAVGYVSDWMGEILQGRSILLGAACAGIVAIVAAGVLRSFGLTHEAYTDPAYMDQAYKWPVFLSMLAFYVLALIGGLLGGGSLKAAFSNQTTDSCSVDLCEDESFAAALLNVALVGFVMCLWFAILPYSEMHGEMFAGIMTAACFAPKGMSLKGALPFWLGFLGFNFLSAGTAAAIGGEAFATAGLMKIASRATLMGTFVGCNIAPLNRKIGFKKAILMGIIYALVVVKVSALHDQVLIYNSGFAIALTVILYNVAFKEELEIKTK